jgi:hypothetical protein
VLGCYTEDLVYLDPNTRGEVRGREAMRRYLQKLFGAWTMTWSLRESRAFHDGGGAHILWRGTFRHAGGGPTATIDGMDLVVLEGDRVSRNEVVFDRSLLPGAGAAPGAAERQRLLVRAWMTHDAMWFRAAVDELGIEAANRLNLRAVRDTAAVEARRVTALLGLDRVSSLAELERFLGAARDLLVGDLLEAAWTFEPPGTARIRVRDCFARRGVSRLGVLDRYQCGIYERIWGWLDALGIEHREEPAGRACTERDGACERVVTVRMS